MTTRSRVWRLVAVGLLAAALSMALPMALPGAASEDGPVPPGVIRLLDDRSRAYASGDRGLLEGTLGPEVRRSELDAFDAASDVAFDTYRTRVGTQFSTDIATPRVRARYPDRETAAFHVVLETRIAGAEEVPYVENAFFTFARGDRSGPYEGWRLVSTTDFEALGVHSARQLWDGGEVRSVESPHFVFLTHPGQVEEVRGVVDQAEEAYREVRRFWPREIGRRYVVLVPSSSEELQEMIHSTLDLSKFVAFAARSFDLEGGWAPAGVRIFLNPPNFRRYAPDGRRAIFAHELLHAVTAPAAGPQIPVWVEEGLAEAATGSDERPRLARRGPTPDRFPPDEAFRIGPTGEIVRTYGQAQVAMGILLERFGVGALADFYEAVGAARVAPGTAEHHVRRAVEELGWSLEEWRALWRERLG